jgi:hypothetical protein
MWNLDSELKGRPPGGGGDSNSADVTVLRRPGLGPAAIAMTVTSLRSDPVGSPGLGGRPHRGTAGPHCLAGRAGGYPLAGCGYLGEPAPPPGMRVVFNLK